MIRPPRSPRRSALVTGANRGIGLEIARQLAKAGLQVALAARDAGKGTAAAAELAAQGLEVTSLELDVTCKDSVQRAVSELVTRTGGVDVLVNNAAILIDGPGGFSASILDLDADVLRRTFETNLEGPVRLMQAVLPGMRARGYGRIVNVSSTAGQMAGMGAGYPAYRMSKAALNAASRITADEIGPGNVKINAMCPGWVRTRMGGAQAPRSVEEGADTAIFLATLPENGPTGGFFQDRKPIAW